MLFFCLRPRLFDPFRLAAQSAVPRVEQVYRQVLIVTSLSEGATDVLFGELRETNPHPAYG
jgi:hypothetical protein